MGSSTTECRMVGLLERPEAVNELANLLRALCANYCTHAVHEVVLRCPLPPPAPGAGPGGPPPSALLRAARRLPSNLVHHAGAGGGAGRGGHPFMEEPPERWEVRHEGLPLQGPALNALPAAMRELTESACYGAGALEFWKTLGGRLEYEFYREGNEYNIVFHGHEIKVVLANLYSLVEAHVLRDMSSVKRVGGGLVVEVSCRVPEGRHYEGSNILGAFAAQLSHYVKLVRAEVPAGPPGGRRK